MITAKLDGSKSSCSKKKRGIQNFFSVSSRESLQSFAYFVIKLSLVPGILKWVWVIGFLLHCNNSGVNFVKQVRLDDFKQPQTFVGMFLVQFCHCKNNIVLKFWLHFIKNFGIDDYSVTRVFWVSITLLQRS